MDDDGPRPADDRVLRLLLLVGAKVLEQRLPGMIDEMFDLIASEAEMARVGRLREPNPTREIIEDHERAMAVLATLGPMLRTVEPRKKGRKR